MTEESMLERAREIVARLKELVYTYPEGPVQDDATATWQYGLQLFRLWQAGVADSHLEPILAAIQANINTSSTEELALLKSRILELAWDIYNSGRGDRETALFQHPGAKQKDELL